MKIAVCPGTFDPVTLGHLDVIQRARKLTDTLYVAVADNGLKRAIFSVAERMEMLLTAIGDVKGVVIDSFEGLTVDYCVSVKAEAIIRGLRAIADFEYEFQMALTNRKLKRQIETIFLMPSEDYTYLSSSMIREIARLDGDISEFVPRDLVDTIKRRCISAG